MSTGAADFEALLREALTPVDPPADLAQRLELTLVSLTELAQEELDAWELSAMRDPRNWVRPAAAAVVGVERRHGARRAAGSRVATARASSNPRNVLELARRTLHDVAEEARRILPGR